MARTPKDNKPVADLQNPPSRFETVDPDESPDRADGKYFGVSPEYQNAADLKFTPDGVEPVEDDVEESVDETDTKTEVKTPAAPSAPKTV